MTRLAKHLAGGEEGATMVEYVLMVGLIALAAVAAVTIFGTTIGNQFTRATNLVNGAGS